MDSIEEQYNIQRIECYSDIDIENGTAYIGGGGERGGDIDKKRIVVWADDVEIDVSGSAVIRNCLLVVPDDRVVCIDCTTLRIEDTVFRDGSVLDYSCSNLIIMGCKMRTLKGICEGRALSRIEIRNCTPTVECSFEDLEIEDRTVFLNSIVVSNCGLYGTAAMDYRHLVSLDLSHNQLTEFKVKRLPNLKRLNLSHNRLEHIHHRYLLRMKSLKHIDLSHNELTDIYPLDTSHELEYLKSIDVSYNKIKDSPTSAIHRKRLETLRLEGNPIQSIEAYFRTSRRTLTVTVSKGVYYRPFKLIEQSDDVLHLEYDDDSY